MNKLFLLLIASLLILSCSRDWNNPFETDSDLSHAPLITNIQMDSNNRLLLYLDYSYGSDCTVLFERKSETAFEPVSLFKVSASVFADTTLDMEQNYNLVYRLRVQKNGYTGDYSNEKQFSYVSNVLNAPSGLNCNSIELQGVRLNWTDNSSKETGFRIEKNVNGSGFAEAADLAANTTTWLDAISGMPDPPQSIIYRIRAYTSNLNSAWTEQNVIYSGLGAPTNLHVTNSNFWEFTITWTRNSTTATGYQVERKTGNGQWALLQTVDGSSSSFTQSILEIGIYTYRVRAVAQDSYSTYSNELSTQIDGSLPNTLPAIAGFFPYGKFGGHWYYVSNTADTWLNARLTCENAFYDLGHLVTISSEQENTFLPKLENYYWIGYSDELVEGVWQWVTGEPQVYANWDIGQPSGGIGTQPDEDCCVIVGQNTGYVQGSWHDWGAPGEPDAAFSYVIEIEPLTQTRK